MSCSTISQISAFPDNCQYCGSINIKSEYDYACSRPECVMSIGRKEYTLRRLNFTDVSLSHIGKTPKTNKR